MDPSNTALLVMMSVHHLSTAHTWRLYRRSGDFISCRGNGSECTPDQSDTLQPTVQTGHQQSFSWTRMCASSISQPAYQCRRTRATQRRLSPAAWSEHSAFSSGYAYSLLHMQDTMCHEEASNNSSAPSTWTGLPPSWSHAFHPCVQQSLFCG